MSIDDLSGSPLSMLTSPCSLIFKQQQSLNYWKGSKSTTVVSDFVSIGNRKEDMTCIPSLP